MVSPPFLSLRKHPESSHWGLLISCLGIWLLLLWPCEMAVSSDWYPREEADKFLNVLSCAECEKTEIPPFGSKYDCYRDCFMSSKNILVKWLEQDHCCNYMPPSDWVWGQVRQIHRITCPRSSDWQSSDVNHMRANAGWLSRWRGCLANRFGHLLCQVLMILSIMRYALPRGPFQSGQRSHVNLVPW